MKTLYLFPTSFEAAPFRAQHPSAMVVEIGVGMAAAAAATARAIVEHKPQRVVLCGIAGAFDGRIAVGEVVEVVSDRVAGLPKSFDKIYTHPARTALRAVGSLTVSRTGDGVGLITDPEPTIEQMEGAAVAAVAEAFGVEYCHLRAISNRVSDERGAWRIGEAITALCSALEQTLFEEN